MKKIDHVNIVVRDLATAQGSGILYQAPNERLCYLLGSEGVIVELAEFK